MAQVCLKNTENLQKNFTKKNLTETQKTNNPDFLSAINSERFQIAIKSQFESQLGDVKKQIEKQNRDQNITNGATLVLQTEVMKLAICARGAFDRYTTNIETSRI
ncbi:MAG: hypothetical protein MZV65_41640 [Chromatiales bacterium]|nr:hypothetical protein [Chromatiales bacterium]